MAFDSGTSPDRKTNETLEYAQMDKNERIEANIKRKYQFEYC